MYGSNSYQSEPDLVSKGDEESTLGITNSESEFGNAQYPRRVHACDKMEVNGCTSGDDEAVNMFPAEGAFGSDEKSKQESNEVSRPVLTNTYTVDSDDDGPLARANTIAGVNEDAPQDAENPCECSLVHLLYHCFVHLVCAEVVFEPVCLCSDLSLNLVCFVTLRKLPGPLREMLCPAAEMSKRSHHHLYTLNTLYEHA